MEISFRDRKLGKIVTDERLLKKNFNEFGEELMIRISELGAVNSLIEIPSNPPTKRHKLKGCYAGCWAISCGSRNRIVVKPVGVFDENDLSTITSIEIVYIGNYH